MKSRIYVIAFCVMAFFIVGFERINAQDTLNGVHLFQSYFFDTTINSGPYLEPGIRYVDAKKTDYWGVGTKGGFPINDLLEVQGQVQFLRNSDDSNLSDLELYARYCPPLFNESIKVAIGSMVTLPLGAEEFGEDSFDFGMFGAARYGLMEGLVLTGSLTAISIDQKSAKDSSRSTDVIFGSGAIVSIDSQTKLVGELTLGEGKYAILSGGIDYMTDYGHFRSALAVGLHDDAPDFTVTMSFMF